MTIQITSNFQFHCIVQPVPTRPLSSWLLSFGVRVIKLLGSIYE